MRTPGINILYFAETWAAPQPPLFARARAAGFDAVEVSLINGADFDIAAYRAELDRQHLAVQCIMGLNPATDITSPDAAVRRAGIDYIQRALEATARLGSPVLCGLPYVQWLYFPDTDDFQPYRDRCAESLRQVAVTAADNGVTICLEVINRFETFMFNTVADALAFLAQVDHPAVKLHLDTYHMNMEEDDIAAAIRLAGAKLGHLHCVASNRKLPMRGHLDWTAIRRALDDIGYDGGLGIEAFPLPHTETGRTVNTWRPLVDDLDADAREAAAFLRRVLIE
jgi:D-psicose/D-tagatose/L-ribulose 3-epimerase